MRGAPLAALLALVARAAAGQPAPTPPALADAGPRLAAVAGGDDARAALLIGPTGQVYAPDGHGAWSRTHAGGIGNAVAVATRAGEGVLVGADGAPPYRFEGAAWAAVYVAQHAKAVVARGHRAAAAVGRQVFALDGAEPGRLPDAPAPVLALGASSSGIALVTARGVARLDGARWRTVADAPSGVRALASERWALTEAGAVDLATGAVTAWPHELSVTAFAAEGDTLLAAAATPAGCALLTVKGGKLAREDIPAAPAGTPVGLAGDRAQRVVLALADGRVLVRAGGAWTTTEVRDALPAARPGPGAALAR